MVIANVSHDAADFARVRTSFPGGLLVACALSASLARYMSAGPCTAEQRTGALKVAFQLVTAITGVLGGILQPQGAPDPRV
jgi:hypothetical protein